MSAVPRRVLCLSGSLRRASSNTALLQVARSLAPATLELTVYADLASLPLFNPDDEIEPLPAPVLALRQAVDGSDALLIACPEYAHGVPGAFKNLLDWLVGSTEFPGKPVVLINASGRATMAHAALREILTTMSAQIWLDVGIPLPGGPCDMARISAEATLTAPLRNILNTLATELQVLSR
ncbi:NAD(P)H-dependent oxidoreductase [Dyella tabacisoli]|uniref:NAD(P)H-dependent oxidoreductase n=1 Tax=Dyella tabacisoli TaxID=2282381 RepID=A0A369USU4_9GAMM|nr:NAD(P)H-dependent oxidoreductase [Dyella tabacisoli]